jgi:hypothetical protein
MKTILYILGTIIGFPFWVIVNRKYVFDKMLGWFKKDLKEEPKKISNSVINTRNTRPAATNHPHQFGRELNKVLNRYDLHAKMEREMDSNSAILSIYHASNPNKTLFLKKVHPADRPSDVLAEIRDHFKILQTNSNTNKPGPKR